MLFLSPLVRYCAPALFAAALLSATAQAASAPEKYYQVELIVFAPTDAKVADDEVWGRANRDPLPEDDDTDIPGEAPSPAAATPEAVSATDMTQLPESDFQLTTEEHRLNNSRDYKVLLHTGWRQAGVGPKQAVAFRIRYFLDGGPQEPLPTPPAADAAQTVTPGATPGAAPLAAADAGAPPGTVQGDVAAPADGDAAAGKDATAAVGGPYYTPGPAVEPPRPRLEGTVRLVLSRYLHLEPDLRYYTGETTQPVQQAGGDSAFYSMTLQPVVYRLEQSRRLRSGELHYFDHPAFGILARVTPYQPPKPATQAASPSGDAGGAAAAATSGG